MHTNCFLFVVQYLVGLYAYLFPKVAIRNRRALGPIHQFTGRAAFTAGLATMAVSIFVTHTSSNCIAICDLRVAKLMRHRCSVAVAHTALLDASAC